MAEAETKLEILARMKELFDVKWEVVPPAPWMNYPETEAHWVMMTKGKWGSESTPVVLAKMPKRVAEHCVALHNAALIASSEAV